MSKGHSFVELGKIAAPAVLLVIGAFFLAYQFVEPAPPQHIRIATGGPSGAYALFGKQLAQHLAGEGIEVEVINTHGSSENIRLLQKSEVEFAFVQSGTATQLVGLESLRSLGSLYFEPIWLFYRQSLPITRIADLKGRRIAIGTSGSGTHPVAVQLLADNRLDPDNTTLVESDSKTAVEGLLAGELDAAFFIASPEAPLIRQLLATPQLSLLDQHRAAAYTRLHRYLSAVTLPRGIVDMVADLPNKPVQLLAATANLATHDGVHPALVDLMLQQVQELFQEGGWFEQSGEFPSGDYLEFPLQQRAKRFYQFGPPLLQRYLPFWAATLADRLKVMLLPLLALLIPLIKLMPPIYRWRMRSRIYRWYREILNVDRLTNDSAISTDEAESELQRIEEEVTKVSVPLSFADELYDLRLHIDLVRKRIHQPPTPSAEVK